MSTNGTQATTVEHQIEELARRILAIVNRTDDCAVPPAEAGGLPEAGSRAEQVARRMLALIDGDVLEVPNTGSSSQRDNDTQHDTENPVVVTPPTNSARDAESSPVDEATLTPKPLDLGVPSEPPCEPIVNLDAGKAPTLADITAKAALQGRLEVLQWLQDFGALSGVHVYGPAATGGHLEVLKWARASGIVPFDDRQVLCNAIDGRHLHLLNWLHEKEDLSWSTIWEYTVARADLEMAMRIGHEIATWEASMPLSAVVHDRPEIAMWAIESGCPWDDRVCGAAAFHGNLALLEWLADRGNVLKVHVMDCAAREGHLEVLKWLRARGCPFGPMTCDLAAANGRLEALQWLHENGCPWGESTCNAAAEQHQYATLGWAIAHGCPFDRHTVRHVARLAIA